MANPWTLPEDLIQRQQEVLLTCRREEKERKEREQRLAVRRMFQDEPILEREKEMRKLQKVFVEGQDPRIDRMAVKYRIELLQEALKKLHEESGTLCDFAVKARRLACAKLGLVSPAEAQNIQNSLRCPTDEKTGLLKMQPFQLETVTTRIVTRPSKTRPTAAVLRGVTEKRKKNGRYLSHKYRLHNKCRTSPNCVSSWVTKAEEKSGRKLFPSNQVSVRQK